MTDTIMIGGARDECVAALREALRAHGAIYRLDGDDRGVWRVTGLRGDAARMALRRRFGGRLSQVFADWSAFAADGGALSAALDSCRVTTPASAAVALDGRTRGDWWNAPDAVVTVREWDQSPLPGTDRCWLVVTAYTIDGVPCGGWLAAFQASADAWAYVDIMGDVRVDDSNRPKRAKV